MANVMDGNELLEQLPDRLEVSHDSRLNPRRCVDVAKLGGYLGRNFTSKHIGCGLESG